MPVTEALLTTACANGAECLGRQANGLNPFFPGAPTPAPTPSASAAADAPVAPRVVTIEDVARYLPAQVTLHAEPDGWAVVGVPANFWTRVVPVTVQGQLLGEQAAVRFTPRIYEWRYGDGATRTTTTGGSSWSGAGQEELTSTSTSHLYAAKATVQASVTVYWSAEYRFAGSDWIGVVGAVSNASPDQRMIVVEEHTVLTAR